MRKKYINEKFIILLIINTFTFMCEYIFYELYTLIVDKPIFY